jgi:glycosyltransferase involved in cell wall biosynthesis
MKILMLTWEYPPKNIGGLSNHVYNLSHALCNNGHEIHVITCEEADTPLEEKDGGVHIKRVKPYVVETEDFVKWIMQLNYAIIEAAIKLINSGGKFDIIHAHDWLVVYAAKVLKWSFNIPMVSTIHATEYGRNNGIRTEMQSYIASAEWMLSYESWKVIACSEYMRQQISDVLKCPWEKIWVISNDMTTNDFKMEFNQAAELTSEVYNKVKEEANNTEWQINVKKIRKKSTKNEKEIIAEDLAAAAKSETDVNITSKTRGRKKTTIK